MSATAKPIRLSAHARDQLARRGAITQEVVDAIHQTVWQSAQKDRFECRHNFPFAGEWNGRYFETRQVRPIFVDEADEIVVVTVYVYYF